MNDFAQRFLQYVARNNIVSISPVDAEFDTEFDRPDYGGLFTDCVRCHVRDAEGNDWEADICVHHMTAFTNADWSGIDD